MPAEKGTGNVRMGIVRRGRCPGAMSRGNVLHSFAHRLRQNFTMTGASKIHFCELLQRIWAVKKREEQQQQEDE